MTTKMNSHLRRRFQRHARASGAASGRHTGLVISVFSRDYEVPDQLVAGTPALRKKTNSIRGTEGVKRKMVRIISKQRKKSTNKLSYMDRPVSSRPPAA